MGVVVRIKKDDEAKKTLEALSALSQKKGKKLSDFYGRLPGAFGNGLDYQKKLRNEWQ
jgi:hypothetical protein